MGSGLGGTSLNQTNERLSASLAEYAKGGAIADNIKTRNVTLDFFMDEGVTLPRWASRVPVLLVGASS